MLPVRWGNRVWHLTAFGARAPARHIALLPPLPHFLLDKTLPLPSDELRQVRRAPPTLPASPSMSPASPSPQLPARKPPPPLRLVWTVACRKINESQQHSERRAGRRPANERPAASRAPPRCRHRIKRTPRQENRHSHRPKIRRMKSEPLHQETRRPAAACQRTRLPKNPRAACQRTP